VRRPIETIVSLDQNALEFDANYRSTLSMEPVIMAKSAAFGVLHLGIAFSVSYALSGSVAVAGAITLVEPLVNTVAHYWFDRWWPQREAARLKLQHFFTKRLALRAAPSRI
jgi:uncharacterized membrane protein